MKPHIMITICIALLVNVTTGCQTEIDIDATSFPPKLSITAALDGGSGNFSIMLMEGRALADYAKPRYDYQDVTRDGEIRLYEDDHLILSVPGPFNLTVGKSYGDSYQYTTSGIVTHSGSAYRLEVDVEGYEMAVSTVVMPVAPVISADIDTTVIVDKKNITNIYSLGRWSSGSSSFWPVSICLTDPDPAVRNYFIFEPHQDITATLEDGSLTELIYSNETPPYCIGSNDLSMLRDNPDMEAQGILLNLEPVDLYVFTMLFLSDLNLPKENRSFPLYVAANPRRHYNESYYKDDPNYEKVFYHIKLLLSAKHITTATFDYYRSLALQYEGEGFFTEPVNIVSNIENGYGEFSVFNSVNLKLIEYDYYKYRYISSW